MTRNSSAIKIHFYLTLTSPLQKTYIDKSMTAKSDN